MSIDTLVSGIHFFPDCDPASLGHKSLAVGLSDLAAVGAEPAWATLALTLPQADASWLNSFAEGLHQLACYHRLRLIGGDLTRGPLSISFQVMGFVAAGQGILRSGAKPGDAILVSGHLGDAGLALQQLLSAQSASHSPITIDPRVRARLERPTPRVELGLNLRGLASAAIDISDGLLADLGHLLEQSQCGADIECKRLPLSDAVAAVVHQQDQWSLPLSSGDDYELCFTVPRDKLAAVHEIAAAIACPVTVIGSITDQHGIRLLAEDGQPWHPDAQHAELTGFDHFRPSSSASD